MTTRIRSPIISRFHTAWPARYPVPLFYINAVNFLLTWIVPLGSLDLRTRFLIAYRTAYMVLKPVYSGRINSLSGFGKKGTGEHLIS